MLIDRYVVFLIFFLFCVGWWKGGGGIMKNLVKRDNFCWIMNVRLYKCCC